MNVKFNSPDIKRVLGTVQNDLGESLAGDPRGQETQAAFRLVRENWSHLRGRIRTFPVFAATSLCLATASAGFLAVHRTEIGNDPQQARKDLESAFIDRQNARKLLVDLLKSREISDYESQLREF